jgi:exosortase D (VPLPA-CTERM-specific)
MHQVACPIPVKMAEVLTGVLWSNCIFRHTMSNASVRVINSDKFGFNAGFTTLAAVLLALVGLTVLSKDGISSLLNAWTRPEYSHGYIIPFNALFLFLQRSSIKTVETKSNNGKLFGFGVSVVGVLTTVLGNLASIPDIITYGMLVTIAGLILAVTGLHRGLVLWPAWIYLIFMLPLPNFIYWPLSIKLQFLSSDIGVRIIQFLDIPVYLDGNIIDLGVYKLQVAEACNGLRYLFPLMSFGFLFAVIYKGSWWKKLILMLSTIPITIGMNSFRIGVIGVLVNSFGIGQAEGFLHLFEGWIIFVVCVVLLLTEAKLLRVIAPAALKGQPLFDLDIDTAKKQFGRLKDIRITPYFIASTAAIILGLALISGLGGRQPEVAPRKNLAEFPMSTADWVGKSNVLETDVKKVLGADEYLLVDYSSTHGRPPVNFLVSYYASQTNGSGMHSPEVCIPAGGWEVSRWGQFNINLENATFGPLSINRAIIQKGQSKQLVYYWFEQRGRHVTSDYWAKAYTVWDSINRGRSDGALVRVVTPIDSAGVEAADSRLNDFLRFAIKELPSFVPP